MRSQRLDRLQTPLWILLVGRSWVRQRCKYSHVRPEVVCVVLSSSFHLAILWYPSIEVMQILHDHATWYEPGCSVK